MQITDTAQKILEERYFLEGESSWDDVASRVANYFGKDRAEKDEFFWMLKEMNALPNSPVLMNAGTEINSFAACFVLPIEDNIESIYKYYMDAAKISKSGGGVGANFSAIRAEGSSVGSTGKVASGPLSFAEIQNVSTETIKQGGKRRGANMGVLDVDHKDIKKFITAKDTPGVLENFNLSVRVTDDFMDSVACSVSGGNKLHTMRMQDKQDLWDMIIDRAWSSAEPGILFGDAAERGNLVPHLGELTSTNPCGEQWLFPYESCTLGSINLSNMVTQDMVDWVKLKQAIESIVLLLNRVIDKTEMPIQECQDALHETRKIGVGIMGLHDLLIQMGVPYGSKRGRAIAHNIMRFVSNTAADYSKVLGKDEGYYKGYDSLESETFPQKCFPRRNAHLTSIQPTGTVSMLADCSSGCEPYYAPITFKTVLDNTEFEMPNKWLKTYANDAGLSIQDFLEASWEIFKGAQDINWRDHVKMQATLQTEVDSSISKTINMPNDATREDIREAYELAWKLGCKGITIYRDGSRQEQVLSTKSGKGTEPTPSDSASDGGGLLDDVGVPEQGYPIIVKDFPVPYKIDLPDKLSSTRYRIRDNNGKKVYFNVCTQAGNPVEVFARLPEPAQDSYWRVIGRLISLCLRYNIPLKDVCKQLSKSSSSVGDVPAKLARILDGYQDTESPDDITFPKRGGALKCPQCEASCIPEGGCWTCHECGWSKCT